MDESILIEIAQRFRRMEDAVAELRPTELRPLVQVVLYGNNDILHFEALEKAMEKAMDACRDDMVAMQECIRNK